MAGENRQLGNSYAVEIQQRRRQSLYGEFDVSADIAEIVNQPKQENNRRRPEDLHRQLGQRKFAHPEMLRHPMRQQGDAPERQEYRDPAKPRYWPRMDMAIRSRRSSPTVPVGVITNHAREQCG